MKELSLIIPFKNENEYVKTVIGTVHKYLTKKGIDFEIIAVDDSTDGTWEILKGMQRKYSDFRAVQGWKPAGYGKAIRKGFSLARGKIVVPFNGDMCDSLDDVMKYVKIINSGYDMAFGSRYVPGAKVTNYPRFKKVFSMMTNFFIMAAFRVRCSDITQSFKAYRREVVEKMDLVSDGYEISLEIAIRAIRKGYKYKTIPISWMGRKSGVSKMNLKKSAPLYFNTVMRLLFNKI
ncbi:MAG: glycosyltransferase [Candidatus Aenigmarchaeota archaeon]|nr:glycosyltransferase [Candidatus Aenigmarchaeota archaeon]